MSPFVLLLIFASNQIVWTLVILDEDSMVPLPKIGLGEIQERSRDPSCNYCGLGSDNTYCKNFNGFSSACQNVFSSGVTEEEKKMILGIHNKYRSNLALGNVKQLSQYTATNMLEFEWDDELQEGAQSWGNQCVFAHDSRNVCRFQVGQNLYAAASRGEPPIEWDEALAAWWDEVEYFSGSPGNPGGGAGHFTQMAWGNTQYIGCGRINHQGYSGDLRYNSHYYICNYGPAGNWGGEPIYETGPVCSKCPQGTSCNAGLCSRGSSGGAETADTADTAEQGTIPELPTTPINTPAIIPTVDPAQQCKLEKVIDYLKECQRLTNGNGFEMEWNGFGKK